MILGKSVVIGLSLLVGSSVFASDPVATESLAGRVYAVKRTFKVSAADCAKNYHAAQNNRDGECVVNYLAGTEYDTLVKSLYVPAAQSIQGQGSMSLRFYTTPTGFRIEFEAEGNNTTFDANKEKMVEDLLGSVAKSGELTVLAYTVKNKNPALSQSKPGVTVKVLE